MFPSYEIEMDKKKHEKMRIEVSRTTLRVMYSRTSRHFEINMTFTYNMYGHTYSKSMDQPGKAANPARGQLNREKGYSPIRVRA